MPTRTTFAHEKYILFWRSWMTADTIMNNHLLFGNMLQRIYYNRQSILQQCVLWFLTKCGDRRDWKWKRTPALAIWSSHLLLASHVSISFSLLLSNIWFKAAMSCSEKAQTVATRLWQKTMSLRSCGSLSAIQENRGSFEKCHQSNQSSKHLHSLLFQPLTKFTLCENANLSSVNEHMYFCKFVF